MKIKSSEIWKIICSQVIDNNTKKYYQIYQATVILINKLIENAIIFTLFFVCVWKYNK